MPESINELNADLFAPEEDGRFLNPQEARKKAMDYLARREYGRQELTVKLTGAGFGQDVAAAAVGRLSDEGLQDERRFADSFLRSRVIQGKGPARVRADLVQRGLDAALIDDLLASSAEDWHARARLVREKKFGRALPANFKDKARQMRFLQYRGFESGHIQAAFDPPDHP